MSEPNDTYDGNDGAEQAEQASAGEAQRITPNETRAAASFAAPMSAADLDARQEEIGAKRRSGPPLPEEEDTEAFAMSASVKTTIVPAVCAQAYDAIVPSLSAPVPMRLTSAASATD